MAETWKPPAAPLVFRQNLINEPRFLMQQRPPCALLKLTGSVGATHRDLISDGLDNASSTKADSVIAAALANRVSFYVIHLPFLRHATGDLRFVRRRKGFRELAEKTGGKFFVAGDAKSALTLSPVNLTPVFQAIEDDLKGQYLVGFYIGEAAKDGRKHRFSVSLPAGVEYQFGQLDYSRKHEFFVQRPREALQNRPP